MVNTVKPERNIVLVLYGGAMTGVFSIGVLIALQEANLYPRIHSVYGISAGAHNAAYFLAEDTIEGSKIYYQNLTNGQFIKRKLILQFAFKLIQRLFNKNTALPKLMDIDYLEDIERNKRKLNEEKINSSPINFYIEVFDVASQKNIYINGKEHTIDKIKAASAAIPFYSNTVNIDGKEFADSSVLSDLADQTMFNLLKTNKKIVCVLNNPLKSMTSFKSIIGNFFWALGVGIYFRSFKVFITKVNVFKKCKDLKKFLVSNNVYCIENNTQTLMFCDNRDILFKLYLGGISKMREFLKGFK